MRSHQNVLVAVLVLQVLTLLGQWFGGMPTAQAQIPDAGEQRVEIIGQLRDINGKLDNLIDLLSTGGAQVKIAKPDDKPADEKSGGN